MPGDAPSRLAGYTALAIGAVATGWAAIFVRLAGEVPPLTLAAYRMLFAALIIGGVALLLARRRGDAWPAMGTLLPLLLASALLAGHFWSWFASLERTSVGSSVVIVTMQPLMAAILGFVFFRERPSRSEYAGLALAFAGLLIIGSGDLLHSAEAVTGDLYALLGALLLAGHRTAGRGLRSTISAETYSAIVYGGAAAMLWVLVLALRPEAGGFAADTWTWIVLLALVPQVVGHTAFNWALGHLRVVTVSMATLGEPVIATLLAIPVLAEAPEPGVLIGGPLILAGVVFGLRGASPAPAAARGQPPA
ncbi:MAG: DMT family transporter [Dehalococcoidia bacterium]|nr:DMT family transporter [Dehalococcoidia bacterium]